MAELSNPNRGRRPGGAPPVKPRKPKSKPKPRANPFAGLPGTLDPTTGKVVMPADAGGRPGQPKRRHREIVRRQQLLRASGYGIVVDGTWGPRSQKAWLDYQRRGRFVNKPDRRGREDLSQPATVLGFSQPEQPTRGEVAAERRELKRIAKAKAQRELAMQRKAILDRAAMLRNSPRLAEKMTLRDLTEVLVDKEAGFDPTRRPAAAAAVQYHLRANGFNVPVSGKFDETTFRALKRAFRREDRLELEAAHRVMITRFYDGGMVKAGDKPWWWNQGPMPAKEELLAILQKGGFQADMMWDSLLKHAESSGLAWESVKKQQLSSIAANLNPLSVSGVMSKLGAEQSLQLWQLYADIGAVQDLLPFGDYAGAGFTEEERLDALQQRAANPEMRLRNAQQITELRDKVKVLIDSNDPEQFKKVWAAMRLVEDEKFKRFQQQIAAGDSTWWGDALETIIAPGDFLRTGAVYATMRGAQLYSRHVTGGSDDERDVIWEDAMTTLGRDPGIPYDGLVSGAANPLLRLGLELTFDPLNHFRPFRFLSGAGSAVTRAVGRPGALGGYHLTGEGFRKALVYEKGTWDKAGLVERAIRLDDAFGSIDSVYGRRVAEVTRRLGQTKDEALGEVSRRLALNARHGYRANKHAPGFLPSQISDSPINKLLDDSDVLMRENVARLPALRPIVDYLVANGGSLWTKADREWGNLSQYGSSLHAYMMENYRPLLLATIAADIATGKFRGLVEQGAEKAQAQIEAQEEFRRIMAGAGTYLKGGGMAPELRAVEHLGKDMKVVIRNVEQEVEDRLEMARVRNEKVILPAIQDYLEHQADTALEAAKKKAALAGEGVLPVAPIEHGIWDDGGKWRHRHAVAEGDLVDAIRQSFDDTDWIDNPMFNVARTPLEATAAIRREISRRVGRLQGFMERQIAADTLSPDFDFNASKARIEKEVHESWEERPDGFWYDTRPELEVSNLYIRHIDAAAKFRLAFDDEGVDMLAVLGEFRPHFIPPPLKPGARPAPIAHRKIEDGLFELAKMMVTHTERRVPGGYRAPGVKGGLYKQQAMLMEAVNTRMHALREAEGHVLSHELFKQGAVWRAWQHQQSLPLKLAYIGLGSSLALWKFATLALRPGWLVRNVIDNVAKGLIAGVRDPRLFLIGPGEKLISVLDSQIGELRQFITVFDQMFNTRVGQYFDAILEQFWQLPKAVLQRVFKASNIEVPQEALEGTFARSMVDTRLGLKLTPAVPDDELVKLGLKGPPRELGVAEKAARAGWERSVEVSAKFRDFAWNIMGEMPEHHMRRVVYRSEYKRALKELAGTPGLTASEIQLRAVERGIEAVNHTLFDYSRISVAEDNLQVFFPFIQFWRKNTNFWMDSFATKPWLNNAVLQFDDDRRREWHLNQPAWMRRYFHTDEIADALAVVPGLDGTLELLGLGDGAQFDPMNMLSFAPFYRAFKAQTYGDSDFMPADKKGHAIFGPMIDALNEWGLGVHPFVRKPLEAAGVANYRAWQTVWPQTALTRVIAERTGQDWLGRLGQSIERISSLDVKNANAEAIADNFDYWVQAEVAGQVARGETPDIAAAEETIRDWFFAQNLWAYFGGIYWRKATPEDMYLAKLQDDLITGERTKFTDKEWKLIKLWGMRGYDRMTYDRYIGLLPAIEAYYRGDLEDKMQLKRDNPEIIRWVDGDYLGNPISQKFVRYAHRYEDQAMFFDALEIADTLDVAEELKQAAQDMFGSPELEAYWKRNRTSKRIRERMVAAEAHEFHRNLSQTYFAIPEDDFEARDSFVAEHPELIRYWGRNNDPADDYEAIIGNAKASLRDTYFSMVKNGGWDKAAPFLKEFAFMFEGTKSESKIKDGQWVVGGGKWSSERQAAFHEAKPHLNWFFDTFMPKVGRDKAWAWLDSSDTEAAKLVREYLNKWSKGGQRRLDYMEASPWLKLYFGMPPAERGEWLRGDSEGAKTVRAYFAKYASEKGHTQHARDYLDAKSALDHYFSMTKESREAWLHGSDSRAVKVLEYFKKYGKQHQFERAFTKLIAKHPGLADGTPEQARRLEFWRQYFALSPEERPSFVMERAEKHGVFVYGEFGEQDRHDREMGYMRRAVGLGLSDKQSAYLYVKPLLEFYRTLPDDQKALFSRANPEIQEYFDKYTSKSLTGDKKLDELVEEYFSFPPDSFSRSQFLRKHSEVQDWFDKRSPAEGAMRNLLEQFFSIASRSERDEFLVHHPEINAYFERRREEKATEAAALHAFDRSDPRLRPFYESASDLERAAEAMRNKLRQSAINALLPEGIETRRERRATSDSV